MKINYTLRAENPLCILTLQIRIWGWKCDPAFFSNNKSNGKNMFSLHGAHFLREPVFLCVLYFELLATTEKFSYFCSRFTNKLIKVYRIQLYRSLVCDVASVWQSQRTRVSNHISGYQSTKPCFSLKQNDKGLYSFFFPHSYLMFKEHRIMKA